MNRKIFYLKHPYQYLLLFVLVVFCGFQPKVKSGSTIVLKDEPLSFTPKEFYITDITDERADRSSIGSLLPAVMVKNDQPKPYPVDLQGGALIALKAFIAHNLPADKTLRPVSIKLMKFNVGEAITAAGMVEGHVSIVMEFDLERGEEDTVRLVNYNGSATYTRSPGPAQNIEPTLRHILENGLLYINTWIDKQGGTNIKLARAAKVTFTDYTEKPEGDTIYYSANRPLTWSDFQSKTGDNKYEAEVFPTIGYDEHVEVKNAVVNINLALKVGLPKSACWVKGGGQSAYALNHEQRHFDIVKIIAGRFKQKIKAIHLTVDNYDGDINVEYLESYREMNSLQKQYDGETRHGLDQAAQQRWNEKIDKELRSMK